MKSENDLNEQGRDALERDLISQGYRKTNSTNPSEDEYNITSSSGNSDQFGGSEKFHVNWKPPRR